MAFQVILPKLGTNMQKGKIVRWLKQEGEPVETGEPLVEIETDKANFELEAEWTGILKRILAPMGTEVHITDIIAIIADQHEDVSSLEQEILETKHIKLNEVEQKHEYIIREHWLPPTSEDKQSNVVSMSPAARRLARESGINTEYLNEHFKFHQKVIQEADIQRLLEGKTKKVVIYGAGLGGKQVLEIARWLSNIEIVGFIDDSQSLHGKEPSGYKVFGDIDTLKYMVDRQEIDGVILSSHSEMRRKVYQRLKDEIESIDLVTMIDPRAIVGSAVEIGEGVLIEAGAVIGTGTKVGNGVIVDTGAIVSHDCAIGDHCHLSPGCTLSGLVELEDNVMVGVGASINSTVTVGRNTIISPGSAVMNHVIDNVVVIGVPAKIIGRSRRGE